MNRSFKRGVESESVCNLGEERDLRGMVSSVAYHGVSHVRELQKFSKNSNKDVSFSTMSFFSLSFSNVRPIREIPDILGSRSH